ncbi:hypothetical protein TNCV_4652011 [Trichonephila clavipes]|nr:hypothetical protein TNCV_4652011 [Trichonephila clavipes]
MEVAVFSFGEASCLVVVQTFTSSTQVQSTGPVIVTRFSSILRLFRGAMGLQIPFHGRQCTMSSHSSCRTALRVRILNVWIGRHDLGSQSHRACMGFLGRRLAARTFPPVTIQGASIGAARRMGSNASQLIDTLILSVGRRCVKPA